MELVRKVADIKTNSKQYYNASLHRKQWICILFPISIVLVMMGRFIPNFAEQYYIRYVYRYLSQGLGMLTGCIPFSLMEWQSIFVLIYAVFSCGRFFSNILLDRQRWKKTVWHGFWSGFAFLSIVLFLFVTTCGMNYYRDTFTEHSGMELGKYTKEELQALCLSLTRQAGEIRKQLEEDENGVVKYHFKNDRELAKEAQKAMSELAKDYKILDGQYPAPKQMLFSKVMSRMELTGIFWGFTMEANVNTDVLDYNIPSTMCHELAHLRGFMREDEANYIGYLACMASDNLEMQYSGLMLALVYANNQLYRADQELYWKVRELYHEGMNRDLAADQAYWLPYQDTVISTISNNVNDTYLKANNQSDGVKSYGRMVDLLLAQFLSSKEVNKEE